VIEESQLGEKVGRVMAAAAQHVGATHPASGEVVEHPDGLLVPRPLVRFGQAARLGPVVVEAMEAEIPVPREHRVADLREVLEYGEVDVHGAADSVAVEHIEHPPEAHPVAVVAGRIGGNVRRREAGPSHAHRRRYVLVVLDVRDDPEGEPSVVRPVETRPPGQRRVVNPRKE
jgi:hypothetical protein